MHLDLSVPAKLLWLPKGETATPASFDMLDAGTPPSPNPEPWWTLEDVVAHVAEAVRDHDKQPWALAEDRVLSPDDLNQAWIGLRAMRKFD